MVIALSTQVATEAELKALTGMANQTIIWHTGEACAYRYENHITSGDVAPNIDSGFWIKEPSIVGLNLSEYKAQRVKEIDAKTNELIALGYIYNGYNFPLSQNGQLNLLGMITAKDYLTYPVGLNNINDTAVYNIVNATDLGGLYMTALGTKKARLDSGTALKTQINNALDELAVSLIIDNR